MMSIELQVSRQKILKFEYRKIYILLKIIILSLKSYWANLMALNLWNIKSIL